MYNICKKRTKINQNVKIFIITISHLRNIFRPCFELVSFSKFQQKVCSLSFTLKNGNSLILKLFHFGFFHCIQFAHFASISSFDVRFDFHFNGISFVHSFILWLIKMQAKLWIHFFALFILFGCVSFRFPLF